MVRRLVIGGVLGILLSAPLPRAVAQQRTVQQPVVGGFQVRSGVVVPDRGSAFLGGQRGAATGRTSAGPFWSGTAFGSTSEGSSVSVHVVIHDLRGMDEALLAGAGSSNRSKIEPRILDRLEQRRRSSRTTRQIR